jgi:kinesin family member 1
MFAYGQTGSGKSYTMFGAPGNRGVVPAASDKIFERIDQNTDPDITFQVTVQMVEIYMEKIQDLFVEPSKRKAPLKIREKNKNVYVEGVQEKAVSNYA